MARTETRFGATSSLGTTYTNVYTVPTATTANVLLNITSRSSSTVYFRAYIATSSWTSGEPTSTALVACVAYDTAIYANDAPTQISNVVINAGEKLVVYSSSASSLDVVAFGVAIA